MWNRGKPRDAIARERGLAVVGANLQLALFSKGFIILFKI